MSPRGDRFRFQWERVFRYAELPTSTKVVGLVMATFSDLDGRNIRPGRARIAACTGYTERHVSTAIAQLIDTKWIIEHGTSNSSGPVDNPAPGRRARVYELAIPDGN